MKYSKLHTDAVVEVCGDDIHVKDLIKGKVNSCGREEKDDAFYLCDLGNVVKKWKMFQQLLPQVEPFYAMKCNPDATVIQLLAKLGANFDCASKAEIRQILDMGVTPERIVFANPCKQTSFIKYAASNNVNLMTFDNEAELYKIKQHHPSAELIIRIKVDDSKSLCKFGIKFGVCPTDAKQLLQVARKLELNVTGVSFHVGSGCYDVSLFYEAVKLSKFVFDQAVGVGYKFHVLDIGGGFPGFDGGSISFEETAQVLKHSFNQFFPAESGVRIIAEPGRFFVASAYTVACNITSLRMVVEEEKRKKESEGFMYYVNDGVYGSFNCILFDHFNPIPYPLNDSDGVNLYRSSVWGPTCDSLDCISKEAMLPKMYIGDWICFDNMGAYTMAAASKFNGFKQPVVKYVCRQQFWEQVMSEDDVEQTMPIKKMHSNSTPFPITGLKSMVIN